MAVEADALAVARGSQKLYAGWAKRFRERKQNEKAKKA
jgi:bifunctional UDP-N-acetylglucosamine pyrophosphorylase/glucosamine-1-phosphate N-acetyltransferase